MNLLDWLFGPPRAVQPRTETEHREYQRETVAAGYCSAWIDLRGKVHDKKCSPSLDEAQCRQNQLLRAGKVAHADSALTWDHNISVEQRYVKGRGKHSTGNDRKASPKTRYAERVKLLRQVAEDDQAGDPCRRIR